MMTSVESEIKNDIDISTNLYFVLFIIYNLLKLCQKLLKKSFSFDALTEIDQ